MKIKTNVNAEKFIWVVPLLVAIWFFFPVDSMARITADGRAYSNYARNIVNGLGYVDEGLDPVFIRGPGFPLALATGIRVLGDSTFTLFLTSRLLHVISLVFVFFYCNTLFNIRVATGALSLIHI